MLTYKQIQDYVVLPTVGGRFKEALRPNAKEWINFVLGQVWSLEQWTFKQATAAVTVTTGSSAVTNLPYDIGIPHLLQNATGGYLVYLDWVEFQRRYYGQTSPGQPSHFTLLGSGLAVPTVQVGPPSSETSSAYQLTYERERGFYPSTTLTGIQSLPEATVTVASTAAAPAAGTVLIGGRPVTYTGKTSTTFTGCAGGTGTFADGDLCVILSPQAGELVDDTDVPLLPMDMHWMLVHGALAIGQSGENDYSIYLADDRVQQALNAMRQRYLIAERGQSEHWGDGRYHTGW